jgi:SAM-dependent methyltransferase
MRRLNRVLAFAPQERWIRVQAGIRWCDLQRFIDPHGLSIKIMQTYANFTVGGALSVNAHGRYIGQGPLILSVRAITLISADGKKVRATPNEDAELFYGAIGGYGALGVIVEAELDLVENCRLQRVMRKLPTANYVSYFRNSIRNNPKSVFHNADLYPPHYSKVRSQTWVETTEPVTQTNRLMVLRSSFPLERYALWAVTETPFGNWRREWIFDPLFFFRPKVHWRNYEAGYDVAGLEPVSRARTTYVLQEYFVAVNKFDAFVPVMAEILNRYKVNVVNISIRHAYADPGSMLAWAGEEVFAFVLYYKQGVEPYDRARVGVWTRELVDAVLALGGTYFLPYQVHPTADQFNRAFPRAKELFALKRKVDPQFRFRNVLWDTYYAPTHEESPVITAVKTGSEFRDVFGNVGWSDKFYVFLQNVFHLYPEDRIHALINNASSRLTTDEEIYKEVQGRLPKIKPFLGAFTHALPALKKQKREMARQTLELLEGRKAIDGYVEIGSTGRYVSELRKHIRFVGPIYIVNDVAPTNGLGDMMERGQIRKLGTFQLLDYKPVDGKGITPESIDLVTSFIGLHHAPPELLEGFVNSIYRILRPGGLFIVRDHDAGTPQMETFVSLVHTVFSAGLGVPWQTNAREIKYFRSADSWSTYLTEHGFREQGKRLLQANDPSNNTLMCFVKE